MEVDPKWAHRVNIQIIHMHSLHGEDLSVEVFGKLLN